MKVREDEYDVIEQAFMEHCRDCFESFKWAGDKFPEAIQVDESYGVSDVYAMLSRMTELRPLVKEIYRSGSIEINFYKDFALCKNNGFAPVYLDIKDNASFSDLSKDTVLNKYAFFLSWFILIQSWDFPGFYGIVRDGGDVYGVLDSDSDNFEIAFTYHSAMCQARRLSEIGVDYEKLIEELKLVSEKVKGMDGL